MRFVFAVLVCVVGFVVQALAGDIVISRAIVVAPPNANALAVAAYFTIENHGSVVDQLIGVTTVTAANAMLHENINTDGVMKMNMLDHLDIPAGATVTMKPAELHVMLTGPKVPYKVGEEAAFELTFARAGQIEVTAKVVPLSDVNAN